MFVLGTFLSLDFSGKYVHHAQNDQVILVKWLVGQVQLDDFYFPYLGVSKNRGTPKSSILIGFSIINHPFWGTPIFGNIHLVVEIMVFVDLE